MKFFKALERMTSAAAFAEAGEWDSARRIVDEDRNSKKILVAYEGEVVNPQLVEYSVGLSQRMRCDMLFAYIAGNRGKAEAAPRRADELTAAFQAKNAELFQRVAKEGIVSRHVVLFDEFYHAVAALCDSIKRLEFVIVGCSEPSAHPLKLHVPYFYFK